MITDLKTGKKVVGVKQSGKAVASGKAAEAFLAENCEMCIRDSFTELCEKYQVPLTIIPTMAELGVACGIQVGAAAAVLLK
ncbi:MAG: ribosomal L7Ae/L30e/S12e/Gadd45 family protein [Clostridiaceae bacterium]|nr:ribosomal L7Ae/L30e/S12e/Gadd45 family protein [Clostridiaceae bacterium]